MLRDNREVRTSRDSRATLAQFHQSGGSRPGALAIMIWAPESRNQAFCDFKLGFVGVGEAEINSVPVVCALPGLAVSARQTVLGIRIHGDFGLAPVPQH